MADVVGWLTSDSVVTMTLAFILGGWFARILGWLGKEFKKGSLEAGIAGIILMTVYILYLLVFIIVYVAA